ncbi:MAG: hypothetical protein ABGX51_01785 [Gammaproteobacteria bacterium]
MQDEHEGQIAGELTLALGVYTIISVARRMAMSINWTGSEEDERYVGSNEADTMDGFEGDDEISSGAGADIIEGGRGNKK